MKLDKFEGPLDLLMQLIEGEELDISEVSLAKVTDSYLKFLDDNPDLPPGELADFLVVASRLLLLKSRILLPFLQVGEILDEGDDLASQLKIYKEYLEATERIKGIIGRRGFTFVHDRLPKVEIGFSPPKRLSSGQMAEVFRGLIDRLSPLVRVSRRVVEKTVSIHEMIRQLQQMISRSQRLSFRKVLDTARSRTEIVVSFLALLELIKRRTVTVSQGLQFEDITIEKAETATTT
ncbi:hypothetical protein AMJ57_02065 [Parcubacteria bacterium SG8_24]|nr:MAG: hypothetical protein AMJ57_02065 [Parcubacteria bacterium SG8_24]